jgi:hypothetical protein
MIVSSPLRPDLEDAFWSLFNPWQFVGADLPEAGKKPEWKAFKDYPIAQRMANRGKLIAIRPTTFTKFQVIDIDSFSRYHPKQNPYAISQLRQALEERLGLAECIVVRSSDSGGIHLWFWFEEEQNSYRLAEAVSIALNDAGFILQAGHLEIFPNCKAYIDSDKPEDWSQYNAIRIPHQEPGSYLLDPHNNYCPLLPIWADQRREFLRQIKYCQSRNDLTADLIQAVLATKPKQFKKLSVSGNKYLNDLLAKVEPGWTKEGQTNQLFFDIARLLRVFGHFLLGVSPFWEVDRLAAAILEYALKLPGREQFCNHNHELEKIALKWAKWMHKRRRRYFPYGYGNKPLKEVQQSDQDKPSYNEQQRQAARERILRAIAQLLEEGTLPPTTKARIIALEGLGISRGSLYRHRDLWHPENLSNAPEPLLDGEFTPISPSEDAQIGLKPLQSEEFTPIAAKELVPPAAAPLGQAARHSELGGSGGFSTASPFLSVPSLSIQKQERVAECVQVKYEQMQSWAESGDPILVAEAKQYFYAIALQNSPPAANTSKAVVPLPASSAVVPLPAATASLLEQPNPPAQSDQPGDLSSVLAQIDVQTVRLLWDAGAVRQYIADQFDGKRQSQLTDDELILLLLELRQLE